MCWSNIWIRICKNISFMYMYTMKENLKNSCVKLSFISLVRHFSHHLIQNLTKNLQSDCFWSIIICDLVPWLHSTYHSKFSVWFLLNCNDSSAEISMWQWTKNYQKRYTKSHKPWICFHSTKAELLQLNRTQFPSLGILVSKKVGNRKN